MTPASPRMKRAKNNRPPGPGGPIPLLVVAAALATLTACQHNRPAAGDAPRPAMTNAEYEMAQLRALGAIDTGQGTMMARRPARAVPDPAARDTSRLIAPDWRPPLFRQTTTARGTLPAVPARQVWAPRTGPVQKIGSSYIGPGGTTSRKVGAIMINSDGTTGQLIGNTIINH